MWTVKRRDEDSGLIGFEIWRGDEEFICAFDVHSPDEEASARTDSALIVKAVNHHNQLVAVCKLIATGDSDLLKGAARKVLAAIEGEVQVEDIWQPIETAPKDGTRIMGARLGGEPFFCEWNDAGRDKKGWVSESYWLDYGEHRNFRCHYPTHWKPIPAPSAEGKSC